METQELFASDWGMLRVVLKLTDEFNEYDAHDIVYDFVMRHGADIETLDDGEFIMKFDTKYEAEQAKKAFRRLSRMRPGFAILDSEVWSEK